MWSKPQKIVHYWLPVYKDFRKQSVQESGSTGYLSMMIVGNKVPESGSTGVLSIMIVGNKVYQNLVQLVPNWFFV